MLSLSPEHIHTLIVNQLPEGIRKKIYFNLHEWEDELWIVVYVMEDPSSTAGHYEYRKRVVGAGTMIDEPVVYKNRTIRRGKVSDEMIALLALML